MYKPKNHPRRDFRGFTRDTTTPVPDQVFDRLLSVHALTELRVLLYIIRRTYGFDKDADEISFSQFLDGITTRDGRRLDFGCGVQSRSALSHAIKSLQKKRIIKAGKETDECGNKMTTMYWLWEAEAWDLR